MKRLDELIAKYCPQGIEEKKIGEVTSYEQPSKYIVKSTDYSDEFDTPVLTAGQTFILGYTNETDGIYMASKDNPVIIFDDFTGSIKWVDFPFKVKSSAMKIITATDGMLIRYLYHAMMNIGFSSDEHKRLWISTYSELKVAVPPLEVQREIVHVLDYFTLLTAELTAELTARKKQYEFYRNSLLDKGDSIEMMELGELCDISSGGDVPKGNWSKEKTEKYNVPIYSNGVDDNGLYGYTDIPKITKNAVTIAGRGAGCGNSFIRREPYYPVIRLLSLVPNEKINVDYLYHCIQGIEFKIPQGGIPQLTVPMVAKYKIPVPKKEVQEQIVSTLNNFETICTDLSIGLPAEIEARQKQYEFYRNAILTYATTGEIISRQTELD